MCLILTDINLQNDCHKENMQLHWLNKSRSEPGNAPRIGIGHRTVVCQK